MRKKIKKKNQTKNNYMKESIQMPVYHWHTQN